MTTECCDDVIGGEFFIMVNGVRYEGMGSLTIQQSGRERTAEATAHGELAITEKAQPIRARVDFANRCNADPRDIWQERCKMKITFVEKTRGFSHLFSAGYAVGNPELDLSTGLVTGIEFVCARKNYQRLTR